MMNNKPQPPEDENFIEGQKIQHEEEMEEIRRDLDFEEEFPFGLEDDEMDFSK